MYFKICVTLIVFSVSLAGRSYASEFDKTAIFNIGSTSLTNATAAKDYKAINFFVKINPHKIDQQNIGGATALHISSRNNDSEATKILVENGANPNVKDIEGYSAALRACQFGSRDAYELISSDSKINYSIKNNKGDGFIILSAIGGSDYCLSDALKNIIPTRDITVSNLRQDLKDAFIISVARDNEKIKDILLLYLEKLQEFEQKIYSLRAYSSDNIKKGNVNKEQVKDSKKFILKNIKLPPDSSYKNDKVTRGKVYRLKTGSIRKSDKKLYSFSRPKSSRARTKSHIKGPDYLINQTVIIE